MQRQGEEGGENPSDLRPCVVAIEGVEGVGRVKGWVLIKGGSNDISTKFGATRKATADLVGEEVFKEWSRPRLDCHANEDFPNDDGAKATVVLRAEDGTPGG